ncbi:MAG: OmpA family protein [Gemmatimonadetes bacterium]|nr:OmpA family protein [Gemmatimonadota bacterium]MBI3568681.1 OmpA family protein [Gemmatimonadota bacterium]
MAKDSGKRPIIIKKVKKGGHAHHGGSWKVAYADFVTAMMAFFMVMWILGMDESTRKAVEGYFSNPAGFKKGYGSGNSPISSGNTPSRIKAETVKLIMHTAQEKAFAKAASDIKTRLDSAKGALGPAKFEITMSSKGLRIELIENGKGDNFFGRGSATMTPAALVALKLIARELIALRNPIVVEGHTDASLYGQNAAYSNWELSADRANAARRVLEQEGLDPARVIEVRGYADTQLRRPDDPQAAENRRISILLPFTSGQPAATVPDVGMGGN